MLTPKTISKTPIVSTMKKILPLSCFFALMLSFTAKAQDIQIVKDKNKIYTIELPADWIYANEVNAVINLMYISNPEYPDERLSISITKGGKLFDLKEVYGINRDAIADFDEFRLLEEGTGKIGTQDCMWLICTWSSDEGKKIKGKQYSLKDGRNIFCVQYHVNADMFDTVKELFDKAISTMVVL